MKILAGLMAVLCLVVSASAATNWGTAVMMDPVTKVFMDPGVIPANQVVTNGSTDSSVAYAGVASNAYRLGGMSASVYLTNGWAWDVTFNGTNYFNQDIYSGTNYAYSVYMADGTVAENATSGIQLVNYRTATNLIKTLAPVPDLSVYVTQYQDNVTFGTNMVLNGDAIIHGDVYVDRTIFVSNMWVTNIYTTYTQMLVTGNAWVDKNLYNSNSLIASNGVLYSGGNEVLTAIPSYYLTNGKDNVSLGTNLMVVGTINVSFVVFSNGTSLHDGKLNGTNGMFYIPLGSTNRYWVLGGD